MGDGLAVVYDPNNWLFEALHKNNNIVKPKHETFEKQPANSKLFILLFSLSAFLRQHSKAIVPGSSRCKN
jgi:hypothetical protein